MRHLTKYVAKNPFLTLSRHTRWEMTDTWELCVQLEEYTRRAFNFMSLDVWCTYNRGHCGLMVHCSYQRTHLITLPHSDTFIVPI